MMALPVFNKAANVTFVFPPICNLVFLSLTFPTTTHSTGCTCYMTDIGASQVSLVVQSVTSSDLERTQIIQIKHVLHNCQVQFFLSQSAIWRRGPLVKFSRYCYQSYFIPFFLSGNCLSQVPFGSVWFSKTFWWFQCQVGIFDKDVTM